MVIAPSRIIEDGIPFYFYREHFDFGRFPAYRSADDRFRFLVDGCAVTPQQLADYLMAQYVQQSERGIRQALSGYSELRGIRA